MPELRSSTGPRTSAGGKTGSANGKIVTAPVAPTGQARWPAPNRLVERIAERDQQRDGAAVRLVP
jgi:hypothetical protein